MMLFKLHPFEGLIRFQSKILNFKIIAYLIYAGLQKTK